MDYADRRREQARQTERRIMQAALALMREESFDQMSVRDICQRAGITTGAFYHHFPSKEALITKGFAPLDDSMRQMMKEHGGEPPQQRLWYILESYARFMEAGSELVGRYYSRRMTDPSSPSIDRSRYTFQIMEDCFRQAQQEGILYPEHSPEWVAEFCYRHFRGVVIDWVLHHYGYPLLPKMQEDYALFVQIFRC
ncbi:MAG: TetR/AcrR family transcriptional regulator [Intestinimonas sp.]|jgi:AcrR family transcriptional regulator|nr:TetR/AcrR family transcriptional regulator [Intestinimonas sp.]